MKLKCIDEDMSSIFKKDDVFEVENYKYFGNNLMFKFKNKKDWFNPRDFEVAK